MTQIYKRYCDLEVIGKLLLQNLVFHHFYDFVFTLTDLHAQQVDALGQCFYGQIVVE